MSVSGHWFDPHSAEQFVTTIESLQHRVADTYDKIVQKELQQINTRLEEMTKGGSESTEETQRQLQEIVDLVGRYKRITASALLEIEQEVKTIKGAMEKASATEFDLRRLEIEKNKLQLERWKLVLGIVTVFVSGLLFPVVLWWLGIVP